MRASHGLLVLATVLAFLPGDASGFCRVPEMTASAAPSAIRPDGARLCILNAGPDCFGCESGFLHECRAGTWRPLRDAPCGDAVAPADRLRYAVPFRHCRYFDADGVELRVAPEHRREAQEVGLIAYQRCETVECRFYDRFGEPVPYAPGDIERIEADLRDGVLAVRSSECRRVPRGRDTGTPPRGADGVGD